ncbi:MAG: hypothetical protein HAW61_00255 [Candidatus Portiera sp.]|nr:hypothetical protein [Portiera sp.]
MSNDVLPRRLKFTNESSDISVTMVISAKKVTKFYITIYMQTYRSMLPYILGVLAILSLGMSQPANADEDNTIHTSRLKGSFGLLLSVTPLFGEYLQYTHADLLQHEPTSESGYGFTLDFADDRGNALALDYYSIYEESSRSDVGTNLGYFESLSLSGPLLGYRHHYPMGMYLGLGFWYPDTLVKKTRDLSLAYKPELLSVLMLGMNRVTRSGFTVGLHLIHSLPTTLEVNRDKNNFAQLAQNGLVENNGELKGLQVTSLAFKLGYSW